jgi:hypothetical protein
MLKTARHVLKADEVTFDPPLQLGLDAAVRSSGASPQGVVTAPSVRIAESYPEYAVIEVTCACGKTTYIRCDYTATQSPARQAPKEGM